MPSEPVADEVVFHFEMKQGFNAVRRFNLTRPELEAMILLPWAARQEIELEDRLWIPARTKLRVLRGPAIATHERGLGRGWTNAERAGEYVTDEVLAAAVKSNASSAARAGDPAVELFKEAVVQACSEQPIALTAVATLAAERNERLRVSEKLALAERAVWELLHQKRVTLTTPSDLGASPPDRWQPLLLDWASWSGPAAEQVTIEALGSPEPEIPAL